MSITGINIALLDIKAHLNTNPEIVTEYNTRSEGTHEHAKQINKIPLTNKSTLRRIPHPHLRFDSVVTANTQNTPTGIFLTSMSFNFDWVVVCGTFQYFSYRMKAQYPIP